MQRLAMLGGLILAFALGGVTVHTVTGTSADSVTLFEGFNEVIWSAPDTAITDGLVAIEGTYTSVFRWDNAGQRWDAFSPELPPSLQGFTTLEQGRVYWLAVDAPAVLPLPEAEAPAPEAPGAEPPAEEPPTVEPPTEQPPAEEPPTQEEPPAQGTPLTTFADGTYRVGVDIAAGRYRSTSLGSFCSWERLSGFSGEFADLIAIELPDGASALVDIAPTDVGFTTSGCGTWTNNLTPATSSPTAPFGDGDYLVGVDVAAGTWRAPGGQFCSWERLAGFSGEFDDLIAIELPDGAAIVTIASADVGFRTSGCGVWQRI